MTSFQPERQRILEYKINSITYLLIKNKLIHTLSHTLNRFKQQRITSTWIYYALHFYIVRSPNGYSPILGICCSTVSNPISTQSLHKKNQITYLTESHHLLQHTWISLCKMGHGNAFIVHDYLRAQNCCYVIFYHQNLKYFHNLNF